MGETMTPCPLCGHHRKPPPPTMQLKLVRVGVAWTVVAVGASRWYIGKLARRYPDHEFRHHKIDLLGRHYQIEARKR